MKSLVVLMVFAGLLHVGLHVPVLLAVMAAAMLWVLWKLKWVILGVLGLEMLFGGGSDGGSGLDV